MDESQVHAYLEAIEFGRLTEDPSEHRWRRNALDEEQRRCFIDLALDRIQQLNTEAAVLVDGLDPDGTDIQGAILPTDAVAYQRTIGAPHLVSGVDEQRTTRDAWSASERVHVAAECRRHSRDLLVEIGDLDGHAREPATSPHRMWALLGNPPLPVHAGTETSALRSRVSEH